MTGFSRTGVSSRPTSAGVREHGATMLSVNAIDVYYGESRILTRLNLSVEEGQVVCIIGRNGVGKTTLLKAVMGLLQPRAGTIVFGGKEITHMTPYERVILGLGYAPQGREIFPSLTVRENLVLGTRRKDPRQESLEYVLSLFPALYQMLGKRGGDLSGGQQQQLAIARALIADPKLLLLDEPTEGIQPSIVKEIASVLHRIRREGRRSIILVEQYLEFARSICDRFYIIDRGAVAMEGRREDFRMEEVKGFLSV